jgi:hypothetical protein
LQCQVCVQSHPVCGNGRTFTVRRWPTGGLDKLFETNAFQAL